MWHLMRMLDTGCSILDFSGVALDHSHTRPRVDIARDVLIPSSFRGQCHVSLPLPAHRPSTSAYIGRPTQSHAANQAEAKACIGTREVWNEAAQDPVRNS